MKKTSIILCFVLGLLTSSCFSTRITTQQQMGVSPGMSQSAVQSVLGKPDFRRFDGDMEEWEFHRLRGSYLYGDEITIIVHFLNKEVVSMDTFKGTGRPVPIAPPIVVPPAMNAPMAAYPTVESKKEITLMTDRGFDDFIYKLKFAIVYDEQKRMINQMLKAHDVTSAQCVKIANEISYTPNQVEMMKKLYPYVRDKRNFNKVIDTLWLNSYKEEMRKFVEEYNRTNK